MRPEPAIESLRAQIEKIEGRSRRARSVLPFGIAEVDSRPPGGGLALGALPADHGSFGSTLLGEDFLAEAVEALGKNPTDVGTWLYLAITGPPRLPVEAAKGLAEVLATFDVERFVEASGVEPLRVVGNVASHLAGEAASGALIERFVSFAGKRASGSGPPTDDPRAWFPHLLEAAVAASKRFERGRGAERFCQFAARLMSVAPFTAASLRLLFEKEIDRTPTHDAAELWKALLAARSY